MLYFCVDCKEALCSDCFMFEKKHKEHEISHLKKVYESGKENVLVYLNEIAIKTEQLDSTKSQIDRKMDNVRKRRQSKLAELREYYEFMKRK